MRVLVIDELAEAEVQRVRTFALSRRQSLHDIMRRMKGSPEAPGDDPQYMLELKDGWKVVYTIEQQPSGWFHHISVSIDARAEDKPWPHPAGVDMILKLFGLGCVKSAAHGWPENTPNRNAINLLFPFTEPVA
jgi:hypothetical protein